MARPTRIEFCGAVYHITARGNRREPIYLEDKDKSRFLNILESVILRLNWLLHSYCIMNNHYHLMIETPDGMLSNGMRYLNSVYSQWFNRKYRFNGHLLQGRYASKLIDGTDQLLLTARYIVLNPVKAHLVEEPSQWQWSNYNATAGNTKPPAFLTTDWLLECFSTDRNEAQQLYKEFVYEGIESARNGTLKLEETTNGDFKIFKKLRTIIDAKQSISPVQRDLRITSRPSLEELISIINPENQTQRNQIAYEAWKYYGYTQTEIGDCLKLNRSTISRIINKTKP